MSLIRDGSVVVDDCPLLADDAAIPASGKATLPWARWQLESASLGDSAVSVGVRLPNTLDVTSAWAELQGRPLIALEFPSFPDGRAYSQARLLRDRLGFIGELRAVGLAVVLDQIQSLYRCGFDSFELREDQDPEKCLAALRSLSPPYQPAADRSAPILRLRRG